MQADLGMNMGKQGRHHGRMVDGSGLAAIDEHASLRVSSPLKQQQAGFDPASPMKNAVVRMSTSNVNNNYGSHQHSGSKERMSTKRHPGSQVGVPKNWSCGDLLGQGAFGSVYRGMDNETGTLMAVKQVSLGFGSASAAKVAEHIKSLEAEVNLLKQLDHPNIVRYLGTEKTSKVLNIFLEYVPGGSIASLLSNFGPFKEPVVKLYTKQILLGLEYLHKNAIMHRDIKGANILVDNTGLVKLADFGASKKIEDLVTVGSGANSVKGTPYWMAPEVITQTGHGRQADIWSVACTVIEMATGKPPWSQYGSQVSAMFHIAKSKGPPLIPQELSPECKDFLYLCFNRNWRERPSAGALLDHPFVADVKCPAPSIVQKSSYDPGVSATIHDNVTGRRSGARRQLHLGSPEEDHNTADPEGAKKVGNKMEQMQPSSPQKKTPLVRASAPVFSGISQQYVPNTQGSLSKKQDLAGGRAKRGASPCNPPSRPLPMQAEKNNARQTQTDRMNNHRSSSPNDGVHEDAPRAVETSTHKPSGAMGESTGSDGSHGSSFNPVEEPDAIQQQVKSAIDSLKTSLMMKAEESNAQPSHSREKIVQTIYSQAASIASSGSGASCVKYSKDTTSSSSCLSGKTTRSNGPIVYTIAAEGSNDSSVPGLPWDLAESWTSGSKHTHSTSQTYSSGHRSSENGSKGVQNSDGTEPRLQTIPSGSVKSFSSAQKIRKGSGSSGHSTDSLGRDLIKDRSWSSSSSQSSKGEDGLLARISSGGLPALPRAASSKDLQTPRKIVHARSAASTPGQTPSRIPRAPLPEYSPHTLEMRTYAARGLATPRRSLPSTPSRHVKPSPSSARQRASIAGEHVIGAYEQKHLKQLERKRSSSTPAKAMGPPPPAHASVKKKSTS